MTLVYSAAKSQLSIFTLSTSKKRRGVQNLEQTELQATAPAQGKYRRVTAGGDELIAAQRRGGKLSSDMSFKV